MEHEEKEIPWKIRAGAVLSAALVGTFPAVFALAMIFLQTEPGYGLLLFLGPPMLGGALAVNELHRRGFDSKRMALDAVGLTYLASNILPVCFRLEGAVCMILAAPLTGLVCVLASNVVYKSLNKDSRTGLLMSGLASALLGIWAVDSLNQAIPESSVTTSILIDAPVEKVFQVASGDIYLDPPTDSVLKFTGSYGIHSRAIGRGLGSHRLCKFSTGYCLQQMSGWEENRSITATVLFNPPPMREIGFVSNIDPPHQHGYTEMKSWTMEFESVGTQTRLTRTTRYQMKMHPAFYWTWIGDQVISRIHNHKFSWIKKTAEERS